MKNPNIFPSKTEKWHISDKGNYVRDKDTVHEGMTLKDYACIKLKIPKTDYDWLNDLIKESLANDFAGQALARIYGM